MIALLPASQIAQADEYCHGTPTTWAPVMGGEYRVSNNVWGSGEGVGEQCLDIDLDSTYFKVTLSTHNSSGVASYPFIYKGCHWGGCTTKDNPMPMKLSEVASAPFTWVISTEDVSGTWNAAFEAWFSVAGGTAPDAAELMIWMDYDGGAGPAGSKVATVSIGGASWDVYFVDWSSTAGWYYIAYKITSPADSVSLDLKDFIHDALTRGYLYTTWYLDNMEAGFEIWRDGQGLTSHYYSATAIGGASPVNYSPSFFGLTSPRDSRTVDSLVVSFRWQESVDPDLDAVEYIFHLFGPNVDTTIAELDTNRITFDGTEYLQSDSTYTWYVEATDGTDTTMSTTQRTFQTPMPVGVELINQIPDQFFLDQNYPNPFNPETEIKYQLAEAGNVQLEIYDMLGCKIKTLVNDNLSAGSYNVRWNALDESEKRVPSGVYVYRLKVTGSSKVFTELKKMLLLK